MTFKEFQATRCMSRDLSVAIPGANWEDCEHAPQGYVYVDSLYIEKVLPHWPADARARGGWYLILGNCEYVTDDLESLERLLYEFAESEEIA